MYLRIRGPFQSKSVVRGRKPAHDHRTSQGSAEKFDLIDVHIGLRFTPETSIPRFRPREDFGLFVVDGGEIWPLTHSKGEPPRSGKTDLQKVGLMEVLLRTRLLSTRLTSTRFASRRVASTGIIHTIYSSGIFFSGRSNQFQTLSNQNADKLILMGHMWGCFLIRLRGLVY